MKRRSFLRSMLGLWIGTQLPEIDVLEVAAPVPLAVPVSQELLNDDLLSLEALINERLRAAYIKQVEQHFLYGDGSKPPKGVLYAEE